jgi:hypothetical protein
MPPLCQRRDLKLIRLTAFVGSGTFAAIRYMIGVSELFT